MDRERLVAALRTYTAQIYRDCTNLRYDGNCEREIQELADVLTPLAEDTPTLVLARDISSAERKAT